MYSSSALVSFLQAIGGMRGHVCTNSGYQVMHFLFLPHGMGTKVIVTLNQCELCIVHLNYHSISRHILGSTDGWGEMVPYGTEGVPCLFKRTGLCKSPHHFRLFCESCIVIFEATAERERKGGKG